MDILEATDRYENWVRDFTPIVRADLDEKHRRMRSAPFPFMRATFYRWCSLWRKGAGDAGRATTVLAIGDLHLENFGTWRDAEGRLVWGINDFDEATVLPWTQDLVRLATSAHLAITAEHIGVGRRTTCDAILAGYHDGLASGGRPFVLEEENGWLREVATSELRDATSFWRRMDALPTTRVVDAAAAAAIRRALPAVDLPMRVARRVAGMGSLGRPRFVGIAEWRGGKVAREAKAMVPSAWNWACGKSSKSLGDYTKATSRAIRVPDPTVHLSGRWLLRRLAPHCTRIELADLPDRRDEERLLYAMGFETANVHLGTRNARSPILREFGLRKGRWLHDLAKTFVTALVADWTQWRLGKVP